MLPNGPVEEILVLALQQAGALFILLERDEDAGGKGGFAGQCQDRAGLRVERHHTAGQGIGQSPLGHSLHRQVDGQAEILAGTRRLLALGELAPGAVFGVDLDVAHPILAAQAVFVDFFQAGFAPEIAREIVLGAGHLGVFFGVRAHVPEQVSGQGALRIDALGLDLDIQGPLVLQPLLDDRYRAEVHVALEPNGAVLAVVFGRDRRAADGFLQGGDGPVEVLAGGADEGDGVEGPVLRQDLAVPGENEAAGGLDAPLGDAVFL